MLQDIHKKKKTVTKVQRWEEKLFSALVDEKGIGVDERVMELKMAYYYQNLDTEYLITAGSISDIENGYLLLSDLGLRFYHCTVQKVRTLINSYLRTK